MLTADIDIAQDGAILVADLHQFDEPDEHGLSRDGVTATLAALQYAAHPIQITSKALDDGTPSADSVNTFNWAPHSRVHRIEVTGPHGSELRNTYYDLTVGRPGISDTMLQWASDARWIDRVTRGDAIFEDFNKQLDTDAAIYFLHASHRARHDLIRVVGRDLAGWLMHGSAAASYGYRVTGR